MKLSNFFLFVFILLSCNDNEEEPMTTDISICVGQATDLGFESCENSPLLNTQICEWEYRGSYTLLEDSYQFLQQYCMEENSIVEYMNSNGATLEFEITQKSFIQSKIGLNTGIQCENDATKTKGICIDNELISILLKSSSPDLEIMLYINTIPDIVDVNNEGVGDNLEIARAISGGSYILDFRVIVAPRTLSYETHPRQEFYETLQLNGTDYKNVISMDNTSFQNLLMKYYFNNDKGLLGFIDTDEVLWTIKE